MSKFKAGDKIRAVREGSKGSYAKGEEFTFKSYSEEGKIKLVGLVFKYLHFPADHFELADVDERQKLSEAIDLVASYGLKVEKLGGVIKCSLYNRGGHLTSVKHRWRKESMLDYIFPTETPEQAKLKELEAKQTRIVEEMRLLRESM